MRSLIICILLSAAGAYETRYPDAGPAQKFPCSIFVEHDGESSDCWTNRSSFLHLEPVDPDHGEPEADTKTLEDAFNALNVLQSEFFHNERGTWPSAIDWTAAVLGTGLSGMTRTLSKALATLDFDGLNDAVTNLNLIDTLFSQIIASYFGQNDVALRGQAYDDILWVVLGWLEAIQVIETHSSLHFPSHQDRPPVGNGLRESLGQPVWHGHTWTPAFAHRARVFWDLASKGWGTDLCRGGMTWNPRLEVYKNAITNQLWISSSILMYLNFPGDNITSPWDADWRNQNPSPPGDARHLKAAIEGYKWLKEVNMTNARGLYVDGYHISNRRQGNTKCDTRDEMVYSYNQGVVLTGLRGLWTATASPSYLEDGHELIQSVILATGWDVQRGKPVDNIGGLPPGYLPPWRGLGRGGVMEEMCDASATCSQDGQTFKGIFFHHLENFCVAIRRTIGSERPVDKSAFAKIKDAHSSACRAYSGWLNHNARAALGTLDSSGRFGMWWGAGIFNVSATKATDGVPHNGPNTTDYRNHGVPDDPMWSGPIKVPGHPSSQPQEIDVGTSDVDSRQHVIGGGSRAGAKVSQTSRSHDPNARGRGRTAETQFGGLSLLRAWWEISRA